MAEPTTTTEAEAMTDTEDPGRYFISDRQVRAGKTRRKVKSTHMYMDVDGKPRPLPGGLNRSVRIRSTGSSKKVVLELLPLVPGGP